MKPAATGSTRVGSPKTSVALLQFLLLVFAGWMNRHQTEVVAYLQEENRVLREQFGGRRLRFTDAQRRRLAAKGRLVGRRALEQLAGLVTPDTILRWYRELIAKKYDGTAERQGGLAGTATSPQRLIHDRDPLFTDAFRAVLRAAGIECLKLPARSPNLNAVAERFVLSIKSECLDKLVPLGERHLRVAISEFVEHYHLERNHQGLDNRLLTAVAAPANENVDSAAPIARRERLGGILSYYYRPAA
jgi:hypothetical protein